MNFSEKAKEAYQAEKHQKEEKLNRLKGEQEEAALQALKRIAGKEFKPDKLEGLRVEIDGVALLRYTGGRTTGDRFAVEGKCGVCGEEKVWSMPCETLAEIGEQLEHFHPDYARHKHLTGCRS